MKNKEGNFQRFQDSVFQEIREREELAHPAIPKSWAWWQKEKILKLARRNQLSERDVAMLRQPGMDWVDLAGAMLAAGKNRRK